MGTNYAALVAIVLIIDMRESVSRLFLMKMQLVS